MKIGRNEPCPCGSGKKYKDCCLGKSFYFIDRINNELITNLSHIIVKGITFKNDIERIDYAYNIYKKFNVLMVDVFSHNEPAEQTHLHTQSPIDKTTFMEFSDEILANALCYLCAYKDISDLCIHFAFSELDEIYIALPTKYEFYADELVKLLQP